VRKCLECGVTLTPTQKKFCSKKCGTASRVHAFRARQEPLRALKAKCEKEYQTQHRSAVTILGSRTGTGSGALRDVGRNPAAEHKKELQARIKAARTELRQESASQRKVLLAAIKVLRTQCQALAPALQQAIEQSENTQRAEQDMQ